MHSNEAYKDCSQYRHEWDQGIQSLLCENGFGHVWLDPSSVNKETFHKHFKERLNNQHIQNSNMSINESNRFKLLGTLHNEYKIKNYITIIRNPEIREIYTRLRIDMNVLSTSKSQGAQLELCPMCNLEPETVDHFLLKCVKYSNIRNDFISEISTHHPHFNFENLLTDDKIRYILNIDCPTEVVGSCCKFIYNIYNTRVKDAR